MRTPGQYHNIKSTAHYSFALGCRQPLSKQTRVLFGAQWCCKRGDHGRKGGVDILLQCYAICSASAAICLCFWVIHVSHTCFKWLYVREMCTKTCFCLWHPKGVRNECAECLHVFTDDRAEKPINILLTTAEMVFVISSFCACPVQLQNLPCIFLHARVHSVPVPLRRTRIFYWIKRDVLSSSPYAVLVHWLVYVHRMRLSLPATTASYCIATHYNNAL